MVKRKPEGSDANRVHGAILCVDRLHFGSGRLRGEGRVDERRSVGQRAISGAEGALDHAGIAEHVAGQVERCGLALSQWGFRTTAAQK